MKNDAHEDADDTVADLIEASSSITGALAGAAVGMLGGPPGVIAGAIAGGGVTVVLKRIGTELRRRRLGPREELRLGAALTFAAIATKQRLDAGETLRTDDFFAAHPDEGDRSAADEVIEGVLLSAERDYEERKLELYGQLLAAIAFRPDIGRAHANYLVRTVQALSYRQLCILALASRSQMGAPEANGIAHEDARAAETVDLIGRGLLREEPPGSHRAVAWSNGKLLVDLLHLDRLSDADVSDVVAISMARSAHDFALASDSVSAVIRHDT